MSRLYVAGYQSCQFGLFLHKKFHPLLKIWKILKQPFANRSHCKHRDNPYHRLYFHHLRIFAGKMKHIEEKAIFFTPKANVFICNVTHGARNMKEMLQKFDSHVLVYLVELTQIQGN